MMYSSSEQDEPERQRSSFREPSCALAVGSVTSVAAGHRTTRCVTLHYISSSSLPLPLLLRVHRFLEEQKEKIADY
ncbi:hypothetical protein ROHU_000728 [Labeo rohita]|uniref:Uncharacterized protein n=1 Tax=Labeo rohita TaxID=84645 RepID=A0A498N3D0_LABRO|nr:hypothetical protein ROHU_021823 [Labeo rohita]RXN38878.1 hypothetical protein ROHU_000728 [Labeo rohita]